MIFKNNEINCLCHFLSLKLNGRPLNEFKLRYSDYVKILEATEKHGLLSVCGKSFLKTIQKNLPELDLSLYLERLHGHKMRSFNLATRLLKILNTLKAENIFAVPVKGPVLAEYVYGDVTKRSFADLDIFIHKEDLYKASSVLEKKGFIPEFRLREKTFLKFTDHEYDFKLYHKETHTIVELHWELSGRYTRSPMELKKYNNELETVEILNKKVKKLPDDIDFIYLCIHSAKHCFEKLEMLYSISVYYKKFSTEDEKELLVKANDMKCLKVVAFSVYLCKEFFDLKIGYEFDQVISKYDDFEKLALVAAEFIEKKNKLYETRFSGLHIKLGDNFYSKAVLRLRLLFYPTCKEWKLINFPGYLSFLYFLIRPFRLAYNFIKKGY